MAEILLFGDSITAGWNLEEGITDALTKRLVKLLPYTVRNAGIPGDTTVEGIKRLEPHVLAYDPAVVMLFFGANDCASYRNVTLATYVANLSAMCQKIGPEKVVLLSTPYVNQKQHALDRSTQQIEAFVAGLADLAKKEGLSFVNLYEEMRQQAPDTWLQADGLHFSEKGYDYLATIYSKEIKQKMRELK